MIDAAVTTPVAGRPARRAGVWWAAVSVCVAALLGTAALWIVRLDRAEAEARRWIVSVGGDYGAYVGKAPPLDAWLTRSAWSPVHWSNAQRWTDIGSVRVVILDACDIRDDDLARLGAVVNLFDLSLSATPITDAAIPHLLACTRLVLLDVSDTRISETGVQRLRDALPATTILPHRQTARP